MLKVKLTPRQKSALQYMAFVYPRNWKDVLVRAWKTNDYIECPSSVPTADLKSLKETCALMGLHGIGVEDFGKLKL